MLESQILTRVSILEVWGLLPEQLETVFTWLAEAEDCHIKSLKVSGDLSSLPAVSLSQAVVRLEHITFDRAGASTDQLDTVFSLLGEREELTLKSLTVEWSDSSPPLLSGLAPAVLSPALLRLEEVNLWGNSLAPDQLSHLLTSITDSKDLRLKSLNLSGNNISSVGPEQVAASLIRLEQVLLINTRLTTLQADLLLAAILHTPASPLSRLYLSDNNLSLASPSLLASAVVCLERAGLDDTNLTTVQVTSILRQISINQNTKLSHLDMEGVDPSLIPEEVILQVREKFNVMEGFRLETKI